MGTDGTHISQYNPATTTILLGEAGRLLRGIGLPNAHLAFIGGLVPSLLVPVLDPGVAPHVGSGDIDLCFSIALVSGEVGAYERIEKALRELGFTMKPQGAASASSWQWIGGVKAKVTVEFFCAAVATNQPGSLYRPSGDVTKGLSAMTLATGALIDRDMIEMDVKVTLPTGERCALPFRVTAPAAFLASKTDAIRRRDKNKDAYDIVWLCEAWPGGQETLAAVVRNSTVFDDPAMKEALGYLREHFGSIDAVGSRAYARFVEPQGSTELDAAARHASGAVTAFIDAL